MSDAPEDEVQVQVRFTVPATGGFDAFTDALYVPLEDYPQLGQSGELERMKAERYEAWKTAVSTPAEPDPVADGPSRAEQLAELQTTAEQLLQQISAAAQQETTPTEA
ncbi:MAG: hypothetical protein JWP11_1903 [Frankiales bacterium]|nr:hypothetical protein [Frankiales bacterium]